MSGSSFCRETCNYNSLFPAGKHRDPGPCRFHVVSATLLLQTWLVSVELPQTTVNPLWKCLSCVCSRIKPVLYTSSKSHARASDEQSYDGPSTSSAHSVPSSGSTFSSYDPRKPPVKSKYNLQDIPVVSQSFSFTNSCLCCGRIPGCAGGLMLVSLLSLRNLCKLLA